MWTYATSLRRFRRNLKNFLKIKNESLTNWTRSIQTLYKENIKHSWKVIEVTLSKWKDRIGQLSIIKMSVFPKLTHKFNMISIKMPSSCLLLKLDKVIMKFILQNKQAKTAKKILKRRNMKKLALPDSKTN